MERVIYTAVVAGKDEVSLPAVPPGWRRVCFTDGPTYPGWENLPAFSSFSDPVRNAKIHKILSHRFFPLAEVSLWIDGNVEVRCDLDKLVDSYLRTSDVAVHKHRERQCIYDEAMACIELEKDLPEVILRQITRYRSEGYPANAGLAECTILLRRHTAAVCALNESWWQEITQGSRRDQLSFNYVINKLAMSYVIFDSHLFEGPLFKVRPHAILGYPRKHPWSFADNAKVEDFLARFQTANLLRKLQKYANRWISDR